MRSRCSEVVQVAKGRFSVQGLYIHHSIHHVHHSCAI
jgi:hypothetical protein